MAFDQPPQSTTHRAATEQQSNEVPLPRITSEEWEYNRYNPGSIAKRGYPPPSFQAPIQQSSPPPPPPDYTAPYPPVWDQNAGHPYVSPNRDYAPAISPPVSYPAYDPIRNNNGYMNPPLSESLSPPHQERSQAATSPIMSISQLLSSDNASQQQDTHYSPIASIEESATNSSEIYKRFPSSSGTGSYDPITEHRSHLGNNNHGGLQNLLNDQHEERYQMADSDTDTEDIPLIKTPQIKKSSPKPKSIQKNQNTRPHSDLSDSSSEELSDIEETPATMKTLAQRTREEFAYSDGGEDEDDDDEILLTFREEMIQFMVDVHKRKKQVIEDYKKKEASRHAKTRERIGLLYEKRYGTPLPRADIFRRKKSDKMIKRIKLTHHLAPSDGESTDTEVPMTGKRTAHKVQDERAKIWSTIARKDIPRMSRILSRVQATRSGNCKKVAQYCQKEVRRAATNGGRANRDMQNKAKRANKEMLLFWKKNEKEERELRKKAEKEALDRLKQEEERREAQRQARKLNFLITQTELYSHFIGRKIKQDTEEDDETAQPAPSGLSTPLEPVQPSDELDESAGVTHIGDVDFDEEDEAVLKEKARLSAQNALAKQREKTREFDQGARQRRLAAGDDVSMNQIDFDNMNFQEPSSLGSAPEVTQPSMLMCQLKSYQIKGLSWLANLYEQGINGILADEMGLGKTVQSISLLAYLAEVHNIWGPFLVIAPASTLHNWQQEFAKFVPQFRALPYWGNPKDRKVLRQFWNRKQLYGKDAPFHIVITSYQLVLTDVTYFQRVKWQYMILDEAQAIKSSSSARWKQLLGFHCRNRLLLTGTPIQNSMQELWALLHFIMPTLFDSHEEFSEWFSKDIESHAENRGSLNQHQLKRLHMILKPFMLRRIKRNVQHELGEKIEVEIHCELTARQRALYRGLKEKISISELLEKATSLGDIENMDSLMNLVMQFRKVCNHPELFERADVESPLSFCQFSETGSLSKETFLYCPYSASSPIKYHIPKKLYRNGGFLKVVSPDTQAGFRSKYLNNLFSIWREDHIHQSEFSSEPDAGFSFLRFVDTSASEASYLFKASLLERWIDYLAKRDQRSRRRLYNQPKLNTTALFLIKEAVQPIDPILISSGSALDALTHISDTFVRKTHLFGQCYLPAAKAVPVDFLCDDMSFVREKQEWMFDMNTRSCLFGTPEYVSKSKPEEASNLSMVVRQQNKGIMTIPSSGYGFSWMKVPSMKDLILDSGKLAMLDKLLEKLKTEGHRCLIYFQMTRMIDLFEEYIGYKQYRYLRLDGSSKISDRRDMVQDWQTRPEIFIFLLSTRAGGLGINLTAADTVIFYDSDWNPTVDQQAMDRAHRLGQTKQVTVYRLITKGTIEERILQRAKQKDEIQKVVISGGEFRQVDFKPREIVSLLLDDEELDDKLQLQLKRKAEEEEEQQQKKAARPAKRSRKQALAAEGSKESTPALSPSNVDRLFSAGEDTFNTEEDSSAPSPAKKSKGTRIGRPRTNFSFTG